MINFLKYFNLYNFKIFGNQNIISNNKSLLFNNSGFSSIKEILLNSEISNCSSFQYCIRIKGIHNDLKFNNDGIHKTSFIMLGVFLKNNNIYFFLKKIKNYLFYIKKINKKKIFFSLNKTDYLTIFILLILKINIKYIFFTKKNIWKISNNGFLGFCLELYYKFNNIMLELWNIVNIKYFKINNSILKLKFNIIDSGLGLLRLNISNFKKNLKLNDLCNTIFLIMSNVNLNFTKNHNFLLNKLIKIILTLILKKKINIFIFFNFFFKKNKKFFFFKNIKKFLNFIIKKEYIFYFDLKKINILKINIKQLKFIFETFGISFKILFNIIKKTYK
ncbi:alanine--tRNA ligase-related protein [Candidatus Carsonella ruddii]|uniref:alanine--tRNA ligase-related protein n=1 Tax=Carsonella ruddii TaxID=114186 RepID=UPI003D9A1228